MSEDAQKVRLYGERSSTWYFDANGDQVQLRRGIEQIVPASVAKDPRNKGLVVHGYVHKWPPPPPPPPVPSSTIGLADLADGAPPAPADSDGDSSPSAAGSAVVAPSSEPAASEDELRKLTNAELRELGATGTNKPELIASLRG